MQNALQTHPGNPGLPPPEGRREQDEHRENLEPPEQHGEGADPELEVG